MTGVYAVVIALAVVVALLGILVVGLLRSHADILRRLESLGMGGPSEHDQSSHVTLTRRSPAPIPDRRITGITPEGESVVLSLTSGADPTLIAFLSTTCSSCTPFWEGLQSPLMHFGGHRHRVLIVTLGENEESPTRAMSMMRGSVDVVMSSSAWSDFAVPGAPYFAVIDPGSGNLVGEGSAMTYEALEEFLADSSNDRNWDRQMSTGATSDDVESRIDSDLRRAGITPGDPRLYPSKGEVSGGDTE